MAFLLAARQIVRIDVDALVENGEEGLIGTRPSGSPCSSEKQQRDQGDVEQKPHGVEGEGLEPGDEQHDDPKRKGAAAAATPSL